MHSFNPFLRTFFKSSLPALCNPINHHIILVPTSECLLNGRDRDSESPYTDFAITEEFLASHILRVNPIVRADDGNARESRSKPKQFNTINGKTIVIKEAFVYSNKGFRNLNQAQLLGDQIYYADSLDVQPWLIYYISKPLAGAYESVKIPAAVLPAAPVHVDHQISTASQSSSKSDVLLNDKKVVLSFNDVLGQFPMIARQMQNGLEGVFRDARREIKNRTELRQPQKDAQESQHEVEDVGSRGTPLKSITNGHPKENGVNIGPIGHDEGQVQQCLEAAITAAIDLFQQVDKQQLSMLGSTTNLTGGAVERLIERYVAEQLHDSLVFPFLCNKTKEEDQELDIRIHAMQQIDVSQVGVTIDGGQYEKRQLVDRIARAVEEFRKLGVAGSPQQMMNILLATQKLITSPEGPSKTERSQNNGSKEKYGSELTTNADTLVSLLLIVVIRSQIRHLHARSTYMRDFIFIDDVDAGEMGYALSTFEAVLAYLAADSGGLRKASKENKRLWNAIKDGAVDKIKTILDPSDPAADSSSNDDGVMDKERRSNRARSFNSQPSSASLDGWKSRNSIAESYTSEGSTLNHVFPFQIETPASPRRPKRVSMDMRSISNFSEHSFLSRSTTLDSRASALEGDISVRTLSQTQDWHGHSLLMMAIEGRRVEAFEYLLSLEFLFPLQFILEDVDLEDTTLLSMAVQLADMNFIEPLLQRLLDSRDYEAITTYFQRPDKRGRTVAHYLFNAPALIPRFCNIIPWRMKDRNGQTPLFALCRSYDHPEYSSMVNQALQYATYQQNDGEPLHLGDHIDGKRNTLLHVVNDPSIAARIIRYCDSDVNATNDKQFTPLMVASKYGRMEMVRALFGDRRIDILAKEQRGMTAVELAKDDEVRNRIDDMVLISNIPAADGRVTAVVRSFFVDDASVRMIIKSAVHDKDGLVKVMTCRRSLTDFENLAKWLAIEHPASWLPSIFNFRSPFQIPSRPSRAVLQETQNRLDRFLTIMLAHSTFSTHELLWEFILSPEIQPEMMAERSRKKADLRSENVREEYEPLTEMREVSSFVEHARESIRAVSHCTKSVTRRLTSVRVGLSNIAIAGDFCANRFSTLTFLPSSHISAFKNLVACLQPHASDPYKMLHQDLQAMLTTILALLSSLARPHSLISLYLSTNKDIDRNEMHSRRSDRWPLGLLDDTRKRVQEEAQEKAKKGTAELREIGCELRYTQQTVASELAGWQDLHAKLGRRAMKLFAERMVIRERDRLQGMRRALRGVVDLRERGRSRQRRS